MTRYSKTRVWGVISQITGSCLQSSPMKTQKIMLGLVDARPSECHLRGGTFVVAVTRPLPCRLELWCPPPVSFYLQHPSILYCARIRVQVVDVRVSQHDKERYEDLVKLQPSVLL